MVYTIGFAGRNRTVKTLLGFGALLGAVAILVAALRPTPLMNLEVHWMVFGVFAACAAILMVAGSWLVGRPFRLVTGICSGLVVGVATLAHPICVLIPDPERPSFETVVPLSVRAARGEPFCKLHGQWYQCKSFISRALFFQR